MPGTLSGSRSALVEPALSAKNLPHDRARRRPRLYRNRSGILADPLSGTPVLEYGATEILPPVGAISKHPARLCRPRRQADRPQPRGKPRFLVFESGAGERRTVRWREMDSNFQYAGAVNLVVGSFGWVVLCDRMRSGRGASGAARYQRWGWAILETGLWAAHRRSNLWCARLGSTRSDDRLFSTASERH